MPGTSGMFMSVAVSLDNYRVNNKVDVSADDVDRLISTSSLKQDIIRAIRAQELILESCPNLERLEFQPVTTCRDWSP